MRDVKETYTAWEYEHMFEASFELEALVDGEDGFKIVLWYAADDGEGFIEFHFGMTNGYRALDEGLRSKQWDEIEFQGRYPIYVVEHSRFVLECAELSSGVLTALAPTHYFIRTNNMCVDVLSQGSPRVTVREKAT